MIPGKKDFIKHGLILVVTFVYLIHTLSIPYTAYSQEETSTLKFGRPVHFLIQDMSSHSFPSFPHSFDSMSSLDNPGQIVWLNLLISYVIVFGAIELLVYGALRTKKWLAI